MRTLGSQMVIGQYGEFLLSFIRFSSYNSLVTWLTEMIFIE